MYLTIMSLFSWLHYIDWLIDWLISSCDCLDIQDFFFSVSLPWKFCFTMPSHLIRNDMRCNYTVCNHWVRSFHTCHLPVIQVLRVEPSLRRSSPWNMVFPYCGFTSHEDQTQFPFPGAVHGGITQQKKVSSSSQCSGVSQCFSWDCTASVVLGGASLQVFLDYFGSCCTRYVAPSEEHPPPALGSTLPQWKPPVHLALSSLVPHLCLWLWVLM